MSTKKIALISAVVGSVGCVFISGLGGNIASADVMAVTSSGGTVRADGTRTPSEVITYSDGGKAYVYDIDGVKNIFPVPPKGFNPLTASGELLARYGFPPKPADPSQLVGWTDVMKHWHETTPTLELGPASKIHGNTKQNTISSQRSMVPNATATSPDYLSIWSGYEVHATNTSFNEWKAIQGDFYQPYRGSSSIYNATEASWVGIGGRLTHRLLQAGTMINWYDSHTDTYTGQYKAWYEYMTDNADSKAIPFDLIISPNDHIHIYVDYQSQNSTSTMFVADDTTGDSKSVVLPLNSSYWDGSIAEFIDERSSVNGIPTILDNYRDVDWFNAQVYSIYGYWNPLGLLDNQRAIMTNDATSSGEVLSKPDALLSNTEFLDHWYNSN